MPAAKTQRRAAPPPASPARGNFAAAGAIVLAGGLAYANSLHGPFVHDDLASIVNNASIQHGLGGALFPPGNGETVTGRPLVNLSLAVNYANGGLAVAGYHAVNLLIHLAAGLALFGLVRRTLELPALRARWGAAARPVALAAALLWVLHPLQTEAVTYVVQRAEALAGLFYLLTFYGLARALGAPRGKGWLALSALACLLGVFCKETIATAPLLALLYDRAFGAGTLAGALRQRGKYYAALAATWLPLGALVLGAGGRAGTAGFGTGISPLAYALTQAKAIAVYLGLSLWPQGLSFDYSEGLVGGGADVAPQLLLTLFLLAATIYLLWKTPALGFVGAWFFAALAPSSSFIPIATEAMSERRMYLALAAPAVLAALTLWQVAGRRAYWAAALALAAGLGAVTFARNATYRTALGLWGDTVARQPDSARAHENYAMALLDGGRLVEGAVESQRALQLHPDYPEAENNLGNALARLGHPEAAAPYFAKAAAGLRFPHEQGLAYFNLGNALGQLGRFDAALAAYARAEQLLPDYAPPHNLRGYVFAKLGRYGEAVAEYETALRLQPDYPQCAANLADARARLPQK